MAERRAVPLPLYPDEWAMLVGTFPMSQAAWDQMLTILEAMRPALVEDTSTAPDVAREGSRE